MGFALCPSGHCPPFPSSRRGVSFFVAASRQGDPGQGRGEGDAGVAAEEGQCGRRSLLVKQRPSEQMQPGWGLHHMTWEGLYGHLTLGAAADPPSCAWGRGLREEMQGSFWVAPLKCTAALQKGLFLLS